MKPLPKAAALAYEAHATKAPRVVASGKGEIARQIIAKAEAFGIPLFRNEALANALLDVDVGEEIPPELFGAVVEVFVWLAKSEAKAGLSYNNSEKETPI
ncbi:MAG: EscU/YscU/HrcU family type III secretion system export apparatus switch protein [Campylobacterales bacterium]